MTVKQRGLLLPPAAVALLAGVFLGRSTPVILFAALACAVSLLAVVLSKDWLRFAACVVLSLALGTLSGSAAFHPSLPAEGEYLVCGVVSDEIGFGDFGQVRVSLTSVTLDGVPLRGGAYWTFYPDEPPADLAPGKAVSVRASLYHPGGQSNPGGYDFRESLLQRGMTVCVYGGDELVISAPERFSLIGWTASVRHRLSLSLVGALGEETGSYASALLLGMRSLIPSEDRQAFSRLGIAHILSVSGFHVGILIGVLALLFRLLRLSQRVRLVLYAAVLGFYVLLCGQSQPVVRAALFLLLMTEGRILNRPRSGLHALCAVMFVMVLFSPVQVTSASFQLTFCAMFALLWFAPLAERLNPFRSRPLRAVFRSLFMTFGIQLGLLFPELLFFQRLPLAGFVLNLPAMLLASALIVLFWLVLLLLPVPGLVRLLSLPLSRATGWLLGGVRSLGSMPGLTLWLHAPNWLTALGVLLLFAGCCVFVKWSRHRRALLLLAGAAALVFSLLPYPHRGTEYIQLSAGNADAAVLYDGDRVIVIDTGEEGGPLSAWLRWNRLTPDAVILTHLHADHAGGLRSLIGEEIPVRLLYLPVGAEEQDIRSEFTEMIAELRASGTEVRYLGRGDVLPLPSGTMTVLWPEYGRVRPGQEANQYSLVTRLVLKGSSLLLTGDLTGAYEHYAAAPADILKAAHHGSSASTSAGFLSAVSPRIILLSGGRKARLAGFRERCGDIPVFGTVESGAVTIRFTEGGFTVLPHIPTTQAGGT